MKSVNLGGLPLYYNQLFLFRGENMRLGIWYAVIYCPSESWHCWLYCTGESIRDISCSWATTTEQRAEDNKEEGWPREETRERERERGLGRCTYGWLALTVTYTWQNYKGPFPVLGLLPDWCFQVQEAWVYHVFIKLEKKDDWKREACTCSGVVVALCS